MSNTHTTTRSFLPVVLEHIAVPLFLFSGVLCTILVVSWTTVLPRLTSVEVEGKEYALQDIRAYHDSLLMKIELKEEERDTLVLPDVPAGMREGMGIAEVRTDLGRAIGSVAKEAKAEIIVEGLRYDADEHTLALKGDVRGVGPQSMTVLAQLIEALRGQQFIASIEQQKFLRQDDPKTGPHSPFSFVIHLQ